MNARALCLSTSLVEPGRFAACGVSMATPLSSAPWPTSALGAGSAGQLAYARGMHPGSTRPTALRHQVLASLERFVLLFYVYLCGCGTRMESFCEEGHPPKCRHNIPRVQQAPRREQSALLHKGLLNAKRYSASRKMLWQCEVCHVRRCVVKNQAC